MKNDKKANDMNDLMEIIKNIGKDYAKKELVVDLIDEPLLMQELIELIKNSDNLDIHVKDKKGNNLLHVAVTQYFSNLDLFDILITKGVSINEKNKRGDTALHILFRDEISFFDDPKSDIIELFVKKGADINIKNKLGWTVLDLLILNVKCRY